MSSSREVILGRVRAALRDGAPAPEIPRDYRRDFGPPDLDLLVERLTDYQAVVHRSSDVAATIKAIIGTGTVVVPMGMSTPVVPTGMSATVAATGTSASAVPTQMSTAWLPPGVVALVDDDLPADRIAAADGVVTAAALAVAETGTIVLDGSPDQGRRIISLLPDLHICVVRPDQVVPSVPAALARLDPTRPLTWISGPSATSDIELNRVEGVHGPRNLHVILWEAS
jgi:L-lactate dehydrogenase complex protein LldG